MERIFCRKRRASLGDPKTGAVSSLVDKQTGQEMLDAQKSAFPVFKGRANPEYRLRVREKDNVEFDSSISQAEIRWVEKGPLRATVKARHNWPLLKFETYVTLTEGVSYVEVTSRVLADVPPAADALDANHRFPAEIKEGYWYSFAPSFLNFVFSHAQHVTRLRVCSKNSSVRL